MYKPTDTPVELSFMESKIELNTFILNLFAIQFVFHIVASIFIYITSYFELSSGIQDLNPKLLSSFALDTWIIVLLASFSLIGYSVIAKIKTFSLHLLFAYPTILILLSFVRDVSLLQIIILSIISSTIVLPFSFQKIKQLEYSRV